MRAERPARDGGPRAVRGEVDGEPTDVPSIVRGPRRRGGACQGRIWPQKTGAPRWPGSPWAPGKAIGRSTSALPRVARRRSSRARWSPSRSMRAAHARLEENVARLGATNVRVVCADGLDCLPTWRALGPCARRRPAPASEGQPAARPPLAGGAAARSSARAASRRSRTRAAGRHGCLRRLHDERGRERSGRRRIGPPASRTWGRRPAFSHPSVLPSCSRCRTSTARRVSSFPRLRT